MTPDDYPALVRAWRGGDDAAVAGPALLAELRRALGAASVALRGEDAGAAPRWLDPPGAPIAPPTFDLPLQADGESLGRLQVGAAARNDAEARALAEFAAALLAQGLANERLRQRNARLGEVGEMQQAILDGADYAVIATDPNGLITSFNAAAGRMLGYAAAEVIGRHTPAL